MTAGIQLIDGTPANKVLLNNRGLLYGDGLFETMLVRSGVVTLIDAHLNRLQRGCEMLRLEMNRSLVEAEIVTATSNRTEGDWILRLTLTRGAGPRGYRPGTGETVRMIDLQRSPTSDSTIYREGCQVVICNHKLGHNPALAGVKHLNRLDQVLAADELREDDFEGITFDLDNQVIEGTRSNLFVQIRDNWVTPRLDRCGVAGVLRDFLLAQPWFAATESSVSLAELKGTGGMFLCNSVMGVVPVKTIREDKTTRSIPLDKEIGRLQARVRKETGVGFT